MIKTAMIIGAVVIVIAGGLLVLRSSARTGMPDDDTLQRAQKRARERDAADED